MLLRPSTTTQFHSTMRHMRPGLSKNSKKGTTMRSCRSGRAGENPEVGGRRGADDLVLKRTNGSAVRGVRQLDRRRQMLERPAETWLQNEAGSVGVTQSPCNRSTARLDRARKPAGQNGTLVYYALQVLPIAPLGQHGTMAPWLT